MGLARLNEGRWWLGLAAVSAVLMVAAVAAVITTRLRPAPGR
jgi:hypothetical protein